MLSTVNGMCYAVDVFNRGFGLGIIAGLVAGALIGGLIVAGVFLLFPKAPS